MAKEHLEKRVLTVKDLAAYLQVNPTTVYRLLRRSAIPAFKLRGDWRFNLESIDAWRLTAETGSARTRREKPSPSARRMAGGTRTDASRLPAVLARLSDTISKMVAPIAEMHAMIPIIKRIAEVIEDRGDAADAIASLYQGRAVPLRPVLDQLFEHAPIPFAVVDRECRAVTFNDTYCQIFGVSPKQLRAAVLTDFVCEADRDLAMMLHRQLLNGGAPSNTFAGRLTADGAPVLIRSKAWALRERTNASAEFAADILERVATREEAAEMFGRCAEDLSSRREKILTRG